MSKDKNNTEQLTLKQQLEAITAYGKKYNSDGMHVLQKAQMHVNRNWIKLLEDQKSLALNKIGDISALAMELSAAEILRKAHIEGEIHIFEHHRSSPTLFYFEKEGKKNNLIIYKDGKTYNLGHDVWLFAESINRTGDNKGIRLSSIAAVDRSANDVFKIDLTFYFIESQGTIILTTTCLLNVQKKFDLTEIKRTKVTGNVFPSGYWILHSRNSRDSDQIATLTRLDDHIMKITDFHSAPIVTTFTSNATQNSKILPRFSHTASGSQNFYQIDGETLRLVSHISSRNKTLLSKDEIDTPIGLAYHENHDSILLRTINQIGIYFPNQPAKPFWRSFGKNAFLPLPDRSMTSGVTFTISCLLHFRPKPTGVYPPMPIKERPNVQSNFGFWIDNNALVIESNERNTFEKNKTTSQLNKKPDPHTARIPLDNFIPQITKPAWFQLTIVKSECWYYIYIDGKKVGAAVAPEHIFVENNVNLSCPGFIMAELRIWNKVRKATELVKYKRSWLPSSEFDGLTAYWHLYVNKDKRGLEFEHVNDKGEIDMIQEPDLSGHGRHMVVQASGKREPGELNYHTYTVDQAPSPFPKFIPLYDLKTNIQNFELDQSTGRIFWSDKNDKNENVLFTGSALGNSRATVLIAADIQSDFALISQTNSLHNELILRHAERRSLIESMFFGTRDIHRDNHDEVEAAHLELNEKLTKQVEDRGKIVDADGDHKKRYLESHGQWQKVIQEMHRIENEQRLVLQKAREQALEQARKLTQAALEDVHASRHSQTD